MKKIVTEIVINASKEKVWNILTNFSNYSNWNSFIISSEGKAEVNTTLTNQMSLDGKLQTFKPTVVKVETNQKLEWIGKLPLGMFNGHHSFEIVEIKDNQVKLIHKEVFTGWISGLLMSMIRENTEKGFVKMNKELKSQAELK